MPANLDSMMFTGQLPWHRLGMRLERPATAAQAIQSAGLDFEVCKEPLFVGSEPAKRVPDRFAICRSDRRHHPDAGVLGIVSKDYHPLQNREAFGFLDPLVGEGAAVYHTAGSIRGGRQIWLLAKLQGVIRVGRDDITEKYVLLSNSHDGTSAVRIGLTPIRVVCQNTLRLAHRNLDGLTIRHCADVAVRVREAHRLLGLINVAFDETGLAFGRMAQQPMIGHRLTQYFEEVMPLPADEAERDRIKARHERLAELFLTGDGNDRPGVRGSLFAAMNAVTQWTDRESYTPRNREPLRSIWFGEGARLKQRAYDTALQWIAAQDN